MDLVPIKASSRLCPSGCQIVGSKRGFYRRKDESRHQRYRCGKCGRSFCEGIETDFYREKRRELRLQLLLGLGSGLTLRRSARLYSASRTTIARKLEKLGRACVERLRVANLKAQPVIELQFDDMETFEHTKCKPLSITLAVEGKTRRILGFTVAQMPANGKLAAISRKKYGPRNDHRKQARDRLFPDLFPLLAPSCIIRSDMNPHYKKDVAKHFPGHKHDVFKGIRGCVVGQGELKATGHDPLFSLNHSCAMLRANISRLFRRTWNTTKVPARLSDHIAIYAVFHNEYLINYPSK